MYNITYIDARRIDEFSNKIYIGWSKESELFGVEFGEICFNWNRNKITLNSEYVGKEATKEILNQLVNQAELSE